MYNQPYFIPRYIPPITNPFMIRGIDTMRGISTASAPFLNGTNTVGKGLGLMKRLGTSLSTFRSINWTGLINNASKTLGVVNQTIPLVKQVGPMVNNMKSMIKVASLFKDETDQNRKRTNIKSSFNNQTSTKNTEMNSFNKAEKNKNIKTNFDEKSRTSISTEFNSPTFFIPS